MHVRERTSTVERSIDVCPTQAHQSALQRHHAVRVVHLIVDCAMLEMHGLTSVFRTVALLYSLRSFGWALCSGEQPYARGTVGLSVVQHVIGCCGSFAWLVSCFASHTQCGGISSQLCVRGESRDCATLAGLREVATSSVLQG